MGANAEKTPKTMPQKRLMLHRNICENRLKLSADKCFNQVHYFASVLHSECSGVKMKCSLFPQSQHKPFVFVINRALRQR